MKVLVAGDLYLTPSNIDDIKQKGLDKVVSEKVSSIVRGGDFAIVNYESPISETRDNSIKKGGILKTGPVLSTSPEGMEIAKSTGFDCVTLANNHIRDIGSKGIENTLQYAKNEGILSVGAGRTKSEAQKALYITIEGIRLAIVNFCENEFSTLASIDTPQANAYNPVENFYQIQEAKRQSDVVLVIVHAGHEMYPLPSPRMKRDFRFFVDAGADAVVCHHAHCYMGYEVYHEAPIFYGLGNFIFDEGSRTASIWNYGILLELSFSKGTDGVKSSFILHPYLQGLQGSPYLLQLLNEDEKGAFEKDIEEKNKIIANDELLREKFHSFSSKRSLEKMILSPYSSRIMRALNARGLVPSFINRKRKLLLTNILRCEAHRDLLTTDLELSYHLVDGQDEINSK